MSKALRIDFRPRSWCIQSEIGRLKHFLTYLLVSCEVVFEKREGKFRALAAHGFVWSFERIARTCLGNEFPYCSVILVQGPVQFVYHMLSIDLIKCMLVILAFLNVVIHQFHRTQENTFHGWGVFLMAFQLCFLWVEVQSDVVKN